MTPDDKDIYDGSGFESSPNDALIKVIGVGGGGCNAVNYMFKQDIKNVNFVVINTDKQALDMSPVPNKMIIGYNITKGLGAGNKPEVGRECAEVDRDKIADLFNDHTEMVFITAGMGGGTGTGAAPIVAQVAKQAGMLTIGIVTVPFLFEGKKKILKALKGANEMREHVDALLVINNENLIELYHDWNFFNAFEKADDTLADAARSISEIISEKCYINVDFRDVKTTLQDSGSAIISTAYGEGEHRIKDAIDNALHSPLLKKHDINTAQRLLFKFACSKDSENFIRMEEISEIKAFTSKLPDTIDVKWGISDNPTLGDRVKVTILASGFKVTLGGEDDDKGGISFDPGSSSSHSKAEKKEETAVVDVNDKKSLDAIADMYGHETITQDIRDSNKAKYAVLEPHQFDDFDVIALLEKSPAFNRPPRFNDQLSKISENATAQAPVQKPAQDTPGHNQGASDTISF